MSDSPRSARRSGRCHRGASITAYCRTSRVPLDAYLRYRQSFYRAPEALVHQRVELRADRNVVWISHRGEDVAHYPRSYEPGSWLPAPRMRPEPPSRALPAELAVPAIAAPELTDYTAPCA